MSPSMMTFRQMIEQERRRWMQFRRALSKEDQEAFDRMFECAKRQAQSAVYFPRSGSLEAVMLTVLLEHQRRIEDTIRQLADGRAGRGEGSVPAVRQGASRHGDMRRISLF